MAGIVFNLESNSIAHELKQTNGYSSSRASNRSTYETLGWVSYGVGAARVASGATMYILGPRSANATVAVTPIAGSGQVGAMVTGGF